MEIVAANVVLHKMFCGKPSFVDGKYEKQNRFGKLSTEEIQEITDNVAPVTTKKATKFRMRLFKDAYPLRFPLKLQNFKYERRDFTHSWRLYNNNNGFQSWWHQIFDTNRRNIKRTESFSEVVLHVCVEKRRYVSLQSSSMKSIWQPPLIVSFARRRSTIHYLWLCFTEANKVQRYPAITNLATTKTPL